METFRDGLQEIASFNRTLKKFDQEFNFSLQQLEQWFLDQDILNEKVQNQFKQQGEESEVLRRLIDSNTAMLEVRERQIQKSTKEFQTTFDQAMKD